MVDFVPKARTVSVKQWSMMTRTIMTKRSQWASIQINLITFQQKSIKSSGNQSNASATGEIIRCLSYFVWGLPDDKVCGNRIHKNRILFFVDRPFLHLIHCRCEFKEIWWFFSSSSSSRWFVRSHRRGQVICSISLMCMWFLSAIKPAVGYTDTHADSYATTDR